MVPTSTRGSVQLAQDAPAHADAVAVFVHKQTRSGEDYPLLPAADRAALDRVLSSGLNRGRSNELTIQLLDGPKPRRLIVVGLGNQKVFSVECLREAGAAVAKAARKNRLKSVAIYPPELPEQLASVPGAPPVGPGPVVGLGALAEGLILGSFQFEEYRGTVKKNAEKEESHDIRFALVADEDEDLAAAIDRAGIASEAQNFARTIASRPGNNINPPELARVAQQLARETGIECRILDEKELKRLGMGGILAVGAGSANTPPRMIVLHYRGVGGRQPSKKQASTGTGKSATRTSPPLLVVGKSITFDSGGISIKPADKMGRMIYDKSGGMAVLGLMYAVAKLKLPVHVVGILAAAENILSESSYRPGDILRMYNGVTVDVTNTDAEGRLVLGDALAWGIETFKPSAVVDLATLTGGVVIALGKTMAGVMSNSNELVNELSDASRRAGEKIWRLPIFDDHREMMKGDAADLVNAGPARDASPLQGGAFLSYFVPWDGDTKLPWAHLDIAGVADTEKELPLYTKGSTGWGVRTLVEWVSGRARSG